MTTEREIIAELTDDGDTIDLSDTLRLKLLVQHDDSYSINEYESDGKVSHYFDCRDRGYRHRPEGFTGRAHRIDADRSGIVWWEPYDGLYGYQDESGVWQSAKWEQLPRDVRQQEVSRIVELIQEGFYLVGLRVEERLDDSLGNDHWVELDTAWIGGNDLTYKTRKATLADIILDQTVELPDVVRKLITAG